MSPLAFTRATKEAAKLRLAIFGPAGSGKTYTALRLATGLGGAIAVIDTERGSSSKYADRFTFDVLDLPKTDIDTYCEAITAAGQNGYAVLIVDSLSHAWHELLDEVERLAKAKYRGNTWSAWSEGTPRQRLLVDAILAFNGHIIATMRTKTEWTTSTDDRGRTAPKRVGLAPEQGKGIEYEFDLLMELSTEHVASIIKDRTGKYQDHTISRPGEELGRSLAAWLADGCRPTTSAPEPAPTPTPDTPSPAQQPAPKPTKQPAPTNGKCPVCHAAGSAHAPWCQEQEGKRVDTRQKPEQSSTPTEPTRFLGAVNEATGHHYKNLHQLANALGRKSWPGPDEADTWQALYLQAIEHAKAKADTDPAPLVDANGDLVPAAA